MVFEHHVMFNFGDHHEDSDDDTLSLRDLPLDNTNDKPPRPCRRSSSEPSDFFEFISDYTSDMCSANDIILCGKLVPFKNPSPPTDTLNSTPNHQEIAMHRPSRKRSESLSEFEASAFRSNSSRKKLYRNSRSLDYRKLQEMERNPSFKTVGKSKSSSELLSKRGSKSRWYYVFMFGIPKFPAEMQLNDMKNRQLRRCKSTLFPRPETASSGDFPPCRSGGRGSWNWKILRALSCKGHGSVPVTTSFACLPEV